jgi:DNA-binding response OmpR family regulator
MLEQAPRPDDLGSETLTFAPGKFVYRGHAEPLAGKPLQVLKAISQAPGKTLTLGALQEQVWKDSVTGQETVRSAVSDARQALRRAIKAVNLQGPADPLPLVDRGHGLTAWRLDLP